MHHSQPSREELSAELERLRLRVAELEQSDRDLRDASNIWLGSVMESASDAICCTDLDGVILKWNRGAEALYGFSANEIVGANCSILVPAGRRGELGAVLRRVAGGEAVERRDAAGVRKDGSPITVSVSITPARDGQGKVVGATTILRDVTERRQAEEEAARTRDWLKWVLSASPEAFTVTDLDGTIIECTQATADLHGYSSPEEMLGTNVASFFASDRQSQVAEALARLMTESPLRNMQTVLRRKNGSEFPAEISVSLLHDRQGKPAFCVGISRDISERQRMEIALEAGKERYRWLFEHSPVPTIELDFQPGLESLLQLRSSGVADLRAYLQTKPELLAGLASRLRIVDGNPAALSFIGSGERGGISEEALAYFTEESLPVYLETIIATLEGQPLVQTELPIRTHDGSTKQVFCRVSLIPGASGISSRALVTLFDLTEERRREEELRRARADLEKAQSMAHVGSWSREIGAPSAEWSPEMFRIFGVDPSQGVPLHAERLRYFHPEDREIATALLRRAIESGEETTQEIRLLRPDGEVRNVVYSLKPERGADGNVARLFGTLQDITDRKLAEDRLRKSEASLKKAEEIAKLGYWEWDVQTGELAWSDFVYSIYGFDPRKDKPTYELVQERVFPEDRERFRRTVEDALERGTHFEGEFRGLSPDGHVRVTYTTGEVVRDSEGRPISMFGIMQDITERKRAEQALQESEKRYRDLFDSMLEESALYEIMLDDLGNAADLKILAANKAYAGGFGLTADEMVGRTVGELLGEAYARTAAETALDISRGGKPRRLEWHVPARDRWLDLSVRPAGDRRVVVVGIEITERKQAEEALRKSEQRFREFVEWSLDGIGIVDEDGLVTEWNRALELMTGVGRDAVLGRPIWEVMPSIASMESDPAEKVGAMRAADLESTRTGAGLITRELVRGRFVVPGGRVGIAQQLTFPIPTERGYQLGAIIRDVTEQEAAERALQESEERYRTLFEMESDAILLVDSESGRILDANPAASAMYGYAREQLLARRIIDLSAEPEKTLAALRNRERGTPLRWHLRVDGSRFPAEIGLSYFDWRGRTVNTVRVADITERRRIEERLLRAERLGAAGQIAGQVAHDFNNLLGPLLAYPELMKMMLPPNDPLGSYCDDMMAAARQMAEINGDMLTLGRRGRIEEVRPVEVESLIRKALSSLGETPPDVKLEVTIAPDVKAVAGAPAQLVRVLTNLASNAIEAMPGGGTLTMKAENTYVDQPFGQLSRVGTGEYVKLEVSDTGHGIADEIKGRIFDAFFTTKQSDKRRGSGLGLAVVQAIVEDHKGYVDLRSEVGTGTSFSLYLPVYHGDLSGLQEGLVLPGGKERILVVDDDELQREVTSVLLGRLGYSVQAVGSGEAAVSHVRANDVDLLILDMIMPGGIDGAETYRRVLEVRPGQKTIVLSGFAESDRVGLARSLGAGTFLRKPVGLEQLARAVRDALDAPAGPRP